VSDDTTFRKRARVSGGLNRGLIPVAAAAAQVTIAAHGAASRFCAPRSLALNVAHQCDIDMLMRNRARAKT